MISYLKILLFVFLIISCCLGNEVFTGYSLNQNLILESLPIKRTPRRTTISIIVAEFGDSYAGWVLGSSIGFFGGILLVLPFQSNSEELIFPLPITSKQFFVGTVFGSALAGSTLGWLIPILGPPVGSVFMYHKTRNKTANKHSLKKYLDQPSFGFRIEKTKENKIIPVLDFRLVKARY